MSYNPLAHVKTVWFDSVPHKSGIEAKWSAFYNYSGLNAVYEPTTFDLRNELLNYSQYTPDFYIDEWKMYHEVKLCSRPTKDAFQRCSTLSIQMKVPVLITWGDINYAADKNSNSSIIYFPSGEVSSRHRLAMCPTCNAPQWTVGGRTENMDCGHSTHSDGTKNKNLRDIICRVNSTKFVKSI